MVRIFGESFCLMVTFSMIRRLLLGLCIFIFLVFYIGVSFFCSKVSLIRLIRRFLVVWIEYEILMVFGFVLE